MSNPPIEDSVDQAFSDWVAMLRTSLEDIEGRHRLALAFRGGYYQAQNVMQGCSNASSPLDNVQWSMIIGALEFTASANILLDDSYAEQCSVLAKLLRTIRFVKEA